MAKNQQNNEAGAVQETAQAPLRKLSEIRKEYKEIEERLDTMHKDMQEKRYGVKFDTKDAFVKFLRHLQNDMPWKADEMMFIILLEMEMKTYYNEQKKDPEWGKDGSTIEVPLSHNAVIALWRFSNNYCGTGAKSARNYFDIVSQFQGSCREVARQIDNLNGEVQRLYVRLNELETLTQDPAKFIDDCPEEQTAEEDTAQNDCDGGQHAEAEGM